MEKEYNITICGLSFSVMTSQSEQEISEIQKKTELLIEKFYKLDKNNRLDLSAIIACMTILEEMRDVKLGALNMREQIKDYLQEIIKLKNENEDLRAENQKLTKKLNNK